MTFNPLHRLVIVLAMLAPVGAPAWAADPVTIHIDNFSFVPQTVTIPVGATVVWENRDDTPHRVVADENGFKSPVLDTDEKYSKTFTEPGSFAYFCSLHPHMTGTVTVR